MSLSISIEVNIPDDVDAALVTRIGLACYPHGIDDEPMNMNEAIQWAFMSPWGVGELASLGITWDAQHQ